MKTLEEQIQDKINTIEKYEPLLFQAIKRRMNNPTEFIVGVLAEHSEETVDCEVLLLSVDIAIILFKQMVAGDVYKK
jgi:hypothetical protein